MVTFKLVITAGAIAGASTLIPSAHAETAAAQTPTAQATDAQDLQARRPATESAQPATAADEMGSMEGKMMADMKAQDAKLTALAAKMKAANGEATTAAIERLLTAMLEKRKAMRDDMMQMQAMGGAK